MPDIRIERDHGLGLTRARQLARQWADEAERRLQVRCETEEGRSEDIVRFTRPGVNGRVRVTAERFELEATLGFLFVAFRVTIAREIESHLDGVLAAVPPPSRSVAHREGGRAGARADGKATKAPAKAAAPAAAKPKAKAGAAKKRAVR